ncbi:hypothetical protein CVU76_02605 [Candidatus Dojkabacteria bacterium HGW-Dojkabacteria-1]|uniref:Bacterial Ig-like domain-containing protein n=1 Tax=Candidatus Dojkabacteria bacterium HGW-Dojkabacteria-1 TaxID=2013761 RepID=A0A2N2F414_9BACT|nr:MAG: hypothetical protein CVU76_02605 [Candidatus Dojkabacteria bacterium HGW-Dojkabacteria-1]
MKKILLTALILLLSPITLLAIGDISLSQLYAQAELSELEQIEQQRIKGLEEQLGFSLPKYTDNPSYVITFQDPSPGKNGIQIEIDGKEFVEITSPYTFPALSIGEHSVKFRFNDKDGNTQTLEYSLIVVPRTPIINPPVVEDKVITINGTGLSNSEIFLFLTSNTYNLKDTVTTNSSGEWSFTVTQEEGFAEGIYTLTAYTRKYGYASELSDATVFEVGASGIFQNNGNKSIVSFAFKDLKGVNIIDVLGKNPDLIILILTPFILGCILALVGRNIIKSNKEEYISKKVENSIKGEKNGEEKTLRELFESNGKEKAPEEQIKINTDVSKKITKMKKEPKVISKEDFLKDFKSVDPDDSAGKEKPAEKVKKEIKVSLTSREE